MRTLTLAPGRLPLGLLVVALLAGPVQALAAASTWGAYSVEVCGPGGRRLPMYHHRGRTYVLGTLGRRYEVIVHNRSGRRVEAVVSVDGRDAIDGRRAARAKRGYIIEAYGQVRIEGFRRSLRDVAAFRFSRVGDSYAARMGNARDVGVIGVAIFPERRVVRRSRPPRRPRRYGAERSRPRPSDELRDESSRGAEPSAPSAGGRGGSRREQESKRSSRRPGLGTEYGERRYSPVDQVEFRRASRRPATVLTLRYDDRRGLRRLGIDLRPPRRWWRRDLRLRESAQPFRECFASPPPVGPAHWR